MRNVAAGPDLGLEQGSEYWDDRHPQVCRWQECRGREYLPKD